MAEVDRKLEKLRQDIKYCLKDGGMRGFGWNYYDRAKVDEIFLENGWKPTNMKRTNRPIARTIIASFKYAGLDYTIYYNSMSPKNLAIVSTNRRKNHKVEEELLIYIL